MDIFPAAEDVNLAAVILRGILAVLGCTSCNQGVLSLCYKSQGPKDKESLIKILERKNNNNLKSSYILRFQT